MPAIYKGDIGLFRLALHEAGFKFQHTPSIFNDDCKSEPKLPGRRLKLWFADKVFEAPQAQQRRLEKSLRELFGDRIVKMYFILGSTAYHRYSNGKSLCIKLNS